MVWTLLYSQNWWLLGLFRKMEVCAIPDLFFPLFSTISIQLMVNKICWGLDSNHRYHVSEATALPTEPQPLPNDVLYLHTVWTNSWYWQPRFDHTAPTWSFVQIGNKLSDANKCLSAKCLSGYDQCDSSLWSSCVIWSHVDLDLSNMSFDYIA